LRTRLAWTCALVAPFGLLLPVTGAVASSGAGGGPGTVAVGTTAPSGTSVNEGLLGTNQPLAAAGPAMQALGIDWARTDMSLDSSYDCSTGTWGSAALDQRVQADYAMGGTPELAPATTSGTTTGSVTADMYGESVSLLTVDR